MRSKNRVTLVGILAAVALAANTIGCGGGSASAPPPIFVNLSHQRKPWSLPLQLAQLLCQPVSLAARTQLCCKNRAAYLLFLGVSLPAPCPRGLLSGLMEQLRGPHALQGPRISPFGWLIRETRP